MGSSYMIRSLIAVVLMFVFSVSTAIADIAKPKTIEETLSLLFSVFASDARIESAQIDHADQSVVVIWPDGQEFVVYPDNLHAKLRNGADDAERQTILDDHIASVVDTFYAPPDTLQPSDLRSILPVLRHKDYRQFLENKEPDQKLVTSGTIGDTDILYVLDTPNSVVFIQQSDLEELGVSQAELEVISHKNLARKSKRLQIEGDALYLVTLDGFYEASMLLDSGLWNDIQSQIGDILLAMPNRDLVVFLPMTEPDADVILRDIIAEYGSDGPYPLSEHVYRWDGKDWITLP